MKKIFTFLAVLALALTAAGQGKMTLKPGSFKPLAGGGMTANESDMGRYNMSAETIEWPTDADGEETLALLIVRFENMAPSDIEKVTASLSKGLIVAKTDSRMTSQGMTRWFFIPSGKNVDVTFNHPKLESARLTAANFDVKNIYTTTVSASASVSVAITTEPAGAHVRFDGKEVPGVTPLTIPDVQMGPHTITLIPASTTMAKSIAEQTINVSSAETAFNFNMYKTKTVTFRANPAGSLVAVEKNGKVILEGTGSITLKDLPYGSYTMIGKYREAEVKGTVDINDDTKAVVDINVIGSRSVAFFAKQNSIVQNGASVTINGVYKGTTPYSQILDYGKYRVDMSYMGYTKSGMLTVNKNTTEFMLTLPTTKRVAFNPFQIEYQRREWGLDMRYINSYYVLRYKGKSSHYNMWGEEGSDNGVQVGLAYQPYFGYGQGLSTGLYWQGVFGSVDMTDGKFNYQNHSLYIPLQYQFRLPLHRNFSIFLNAGAQMTVGVSHTGKFEGDSDSFDLGYGYNDEYEVSSPERFDYGLLFGGGIQIKALQIEGKYMMGLKNHKQMLTDEDIADGVTYKSGFWGVGLALMF